MEIKQVVRILPSGEQETVLATDLEVGDRFIDEMLKQEGVVVKVNEGQIAYRLPDGVISLADIPKLTA